jgi:radical SAM superfamily enzyme YgiQ (UPF0313 family)
MIHERGMLVNASLVFGFDHDDESVFPATLAWLLRMRVSSMTAHILTPYPGTPFYDRLRCEGRIIDENLDHYNTSRAVFRPARMSPGALERGYRGMYKNFYSWRGILKRWPETRSQVSAYLQFNLFYRKFGKAACRLGRVFGMRRTAELARHIAYPVRRRGRARENPARIPDWIHNTMHGTIWRRSHAG